MRVHHASRRDGGADTWPGGDDPVTVLAVDDHDSFRAVLRELIAATAGFVLVGEATSGERALEILDEVSPRMVIIDKRMPGMGGIEACRLIAKRHPEVVVFLISVEDHYEAQLARSCGAAAVVSKEDLSTRMLRELWGAVGRPAAGGD